jgi:hypothetical protein
LKLSSDDGDSGSKKYKRGYSTACGKGLRSLCLTGDWSQAVSIVFVRAFGSRRENVFMFKLFYKEISTFCNFNAI